MLHIFDLDHTLIKKNISVSFGAYLYKNKQFSFLKMLRLLSLYFLHKCKILSIQKLHKLIFTQLFWGKQASYFLQEAQKFLNEHLENLWDVIVLEKLRNSEGKIALMSSSPDFLVQAIAKRLDCDFWLGSIYKISQDQFSEIGHVVDGNDKAEMAKQLSEKLNIPLSKMTAYSDSYLDIPLLEMVGHPIAVNPDSQLAEISAKKNWTVLTTRKG